MTEKELQKQLVNLHQTRAPKSVHAFVRAQTAGLSERHHGLYVPLIAFRFGMVAAVILLCVVAASGIFVAANHSSTKIPLNPVNVLLQHIVPHTQIQQQNVQEAIAPTATPVPTRQTAMTTPTVAVKQHDTITSSGKTDEETTNNPVSNWVHEIKHVIHNDFSHGDSFKSHGDENSSFKQQNKNK